MSINIQLETQEVEHVLAAVGEKSINERIGLWMKIREQAVMQVQAQAQQAAPAAMQVPADAPDAE